MIALTLLLLAAGADPAPDASKPKMVCKTIVMTGSRLGGRKICQTKADWEAANDRTHRGVLEAQTHAPHVASPSPGGGI